MDPEPGRCRRTDGKKWRCSRDVVPDQKYCERHMHRGRQRSRKHVEVTVKVTKSIPPKTDNSKKTPKSIKPPGSANKLSNSSPQPPEVLKQIHHPSSNTSYKVCSSATPASTTPPNVLSNSKSSIVAPRSDIPPKGVLQSRVGCATPTVPLPEMPLRNTEPQRCRRTDGRKWRCSSDVLPTHKYCVQHIHRGVKKLTTPSNPITIAYSPPPLAIPKNLNMGLSAHETPMSDDGTSTSGSSSDATTITDDENTSDSSKYIIRARDSNIQAPF